jgi:hypothetical protein
MTSIYEPFAEVLSERVRLRRAQRKGRFPIIRGWKRRLAWRRLFRTIVLYAREVDYTPIVDTSGRLMGVTLDVDARPSMNDAASHGDGYVSATRPSCP